MQEEKVKHMQSLDEENNVVSATEMTGAIPSLTDQAPNLPPLPCGSARPYDTHTQPRSAQLPHPAKAPGPYRPDSARNP